VYAKPGVPFYTCAVQPTKTSRAIRAEASQGDWLALAPELERKSIDLLYADPPFNTGQKQSDRAGEFDDRFESREAYVRWLGERLSATLPALKPTASVLLHVDWRASHLVRVMLDEVMGEANFVNHIVWSYGLGGSSPKRFSRKHDDIFLYAVDADRAYFDPPMVPATSQRMKGKLKKATDVLNIPSINNMKATDVLDIPNINNMAKERVGWPTQKPLALLELLVRACAPEGGTVLDPTCGSGTTLVASLTNGRHAIGFDINEDAVAVARARLAATGLLR